jgi:hypothetical protein
MAETDKILLKAEVVQAPITLAFTQRRGLAGKVVVDEVIGKRVGIKAGDRVVWERRVFPVYIGLKRFGITLQRSNFDKRVAATEQKARGKAAAINFINTDWE